MGMVTAKWFLKEARCPLVSWKEEYHGDRNVVQWRAVRLFAWSLSHSMGMVAEKWFLNEAGRGLGRSQKRLPALLFRRSR